MNSIWPIMHLTSGLAFRNLLRKLFFSSGSIFLLATILAQVASVVRIVSLPYMLSPEDLGHWSLFNMLIAYGANSHLGFLHGMNKIYPALKAKGEQTCAEDLRDSVFTICGILGVLGSILIGAIGIFRFPDQLSSVAAVALIIAFQSVHTYYFSLLRAENRFRAAGLVVASTAVLGTVLTIGAVLIRGSSVLNAIIGLAVSQAIVALMVTLLTRTRPALKLQGSILKKAIVAGFPILVVGFADMFLTTADRWILSSHVSPTDFGFYSLAVMVCGALTMFSSVASSLTYTRLIELHAAPNGTGESRQLFEKAFTLLAFLLMIIVIAIWHVVPLLVEQYAVRYMPAIPLLKVLTVGYFFLALAGSTGTFAIAGDRQNTLLVRQCVVLGLLLGLCFLVVKLDGGLLLFGTVVSSLLLLFFILYLDAAYAAERDRWLKVLRITAGQGIPLAIAWQTHSLLDAPAGDSPILDLLFCAIRILLCWGSAIVAFLLMNRKSVGLWYQELTQPQKSLKTESF